MREGAQKKSALTGICSPVIIPHLPNEVAVMILARLPRALHGSFRRVCLAWRDALEPSSIYALRNSLRVSETWIVFDLGNCIAFYDPLLHHSSYPIHFPLPQPTSYFLLGATGRYILVQRHWNGLLTGKIHCFDVVRMQWQPDLIPSWDKLKAVYSFKSVAIDGDLYVIQSTGRVARLDISARTWELLPRMNETRMFSRVVALQGRLCVCGGLGDHGFVLHSEIWDPSSHTWVILEPVWPHHVVEPFYYPHFVMVMDTLYVLKKASIRRHEDEWELMQYVSASKLWVSFGCFRMEEPLCRFCSQKKKILFVGAGKEILAIFSCSTLSRNCRFEISSHVPAMGSSPCLWRTLPFTSSGEFLGGYVDMVNGTVNV